jgi:hypothetical protein
VHGQYLRLMLHEASQLLWSSLNVLPLSKTLFSLEDDEWEGQGVFQQCERERYKTRRDHK